MMFPTAVLLFALVCVSQLPVFYSKNVGFDSSPFCQHDPCVEAFATTFFTARLVDYGCDTVSGVEVTGEEAAKSEYDVVLDVLQKEGACNADWVAYTCAWPLRHIPKVSASYYLEKSAHGAGKVFLQTGLLDCGNSISLALEWYSLARNASRGLDPHKLESFQRGDAQGLVDLVRKHGLNLEDAANNLAFSFYNEFSESHDGNCTPPKN